MKVVFHLSMSVLSVREHRTCVEDEVVSENLLLGLQLISHLPPWLTNPDPSSLSDEGSHQSIVQISPNLTISIYTQHLHARDLNLPWPLELLHHDLHIRFKSPIPIIWDFEYENEDNLPHDASSVLQLQLINIIHRISEFPLYF